MWICLVITAIALYVFPSLLQIKKLLKKLLKLKNSKSFKKIRIRSVACFPIKRTYTRGAKEGTKGADDPFQILAKSFLFIALKRKLNFETPSNILNSECTKL